ncbi:MAG: hypothetical protein ACI4AB_07415 [Acetatifactor sp.]
MEKYCKSEKELAEAIKSNEDTIYIEGNLKDKVIRIKATGKVAWGVCATGLSAAILLYVATKPTMLVNPPAAGAEAVAGTVVVGATTAVLGNAAVSAVLIGVAAGGIGALTTLRDKYKIIEKSDKYIKLKRK